jgi:hypothetical protein
MTAFKRIVGSEDSSPLRAMLHAHESRDELPQVGAPDPELRTSPMVDEDEERTLDLEQGTSVCYYNGAAYPVGQYVVSGSELLHCESGGVWVRRGELRR